MNDKRSTGFLRRAANIYEQLLKSDRSNADKETIKTNLSKISAYLNETVEQEATENYQENLKTDRHSPTT